MGYLVTWQLMDEIFDSDIRGCSPMLMPPLFDKMTFRSFYNMRKTLRSHLRVARDYVEAQTPHIVNWQVYSGWIQGVLSLGALRVSVCSFCQIFLCPEVLFSTSHDLRYKIIYWRLQPGHLETRQQRDHFFTLYFVTSIQPEPGLYCIKDEDHRLGLRGIEYNDFVYAPSIVIDQSYHED